MTEEQRNAIRQRLEGMNGIYSRNTSQESQRKMTRVY